MITVPEVVTDIVKQSPFLEEGLEKNIINLSQLARLLRPEIEKELYKEVSEAAIVMALKRLTLSMQSKKKIQSVFKTVPDMIVRSHLIEITVLNSPSLPIKHKKLLEATALSPNFFTITTGLFETTIIASKELEEKILEVLKGEVMVTTFKDLSAITVRLTKEVVTIPGVYYHILKILAWDNINIFEVVSAYTEFTIILEEKNVDRAFSTLKKSLLTIKY